MVGMLCVECARTGDAWAPAVTLPSLVHVGIRLFWSEAPLVWGAGERVEGWVDRLGQRSLQPEIIVRSTFMPSPMQGAFLKHQVYTRHQANNNDYQLLILLIKDLSIKGLIKDLPIKGLWLAFTFEPAAQVQVHPRYKHVPMITRKSTVTKQPGKPPVRDGGSEPEDRKGGLQRQGLQPRV